jgi:hypothetical protein
MEYVGTARSYWTATGPISSSVMVRSVAVFEAGQYLFSIVDNIA